MRKISQKKYVYLLATGVFIALACSAVFLVQGQFIHESVPTLPKELIMDKHNNAPETTNKPNEAYKGEMTLVANSFEIKIPNGWRGSVSNDTSFLAIMFARPNQLGSLAYDTTTPPIIDQLGIPSWSGLTEHFFVIMPTDTQQFNPNDHLEVSSEPFTFDDGTTGQKYYVVKHVREAQKWGGLQKGTEWQGHTYIYEKAGKRIEAHLALYPSTNIDIKFYENVVRSLRVLSS